MNAVEAGSTLDAPVDGHDPLAAAPDQAMPTIRVATDAGPGNAAARTPGEIVVELRDVSCYYGSFRAVKDVSDHRGEARGHRPDRPVRLRQVDPAADASTG